MKRSDAVRLLTAFINFNTHKTVDKFSGDYMCTLEEGENVITFLEKQGFYPPDSYYDEDQGIVPFWELEDHEVEAIEKERQEFFENLPRNLPTSKLNRFTGKEYSSVRHKYAEAWNEGLTIQEIADKFNVTRIRVESFLKLLEKDMRDED